MQNGKSKSNLVSQNLHSLIGWLSSLSVDIFLFNWLEHFYTRNIPLLLRIQLSCVYFSYERSFFTVVISASEALFSNQTFIIINDHEIVNVFKGQDVIQFRVFHRLFHCRPMSPSCANCPKTNHLLSKTSHRISHAILQDRTTTITIQDNL